MRVTDKKATEDPQAQELREYISQHSGQRMIERLNAQAVLDEQLRLSLKEKRELRTRMLENLGGNEEELKKLDHEIQQLDEVFQKMNPRRNAPPIVQDMTSVRDASQAKQRGITIRE
eukprot:TRINITY_DN800_c0_g1_i6.p1 TRINITY_DN800_c0_g1~~TRINITY_DN800_c0_g1_i6.p1  ORF type:complete len:117 (+),score=21.90 TRINITY_DN800_c0_g1_i6:272-622(+)